MFDKIMAKLKKSFTKGDTIEQQFRRNNRVTCPSSSIILSGTKIENRVSAESRKYVIIGEECILKAQFVFESTSGIVRIGSNVHMGGVQLICRTFITIGDDVTMAWGITIYDHDSHSLAWNFRKHDNAQCYKDFNSYDGNNIVNKDWTHVASQGIAIGPKVWIGFGVTILKGVTIGEGAVIGAQSVVTRNVPAWTLVAGNPARIIRTLEKPEGL